MYDPDEHTRALAVAQRALDLHTILQEQAKMASNESTRKALNDAADALDCWIQDELNNGVLAVIEAAEYDAGASGHLREAMRAPMDKPPALGISERYRR